MTSSTLVVASIFAPRLDQWGCDYMECLAVLQASCDRLGLRHVVISDRPLDPFETAIFDLPQELMPLLLEGQRAFLAATDAPVLLVGADCIVTSDPRPVLEDCDLAVTVHPFHDCVLNTGAIWCGNGKAIAPLWQAALKRNPREWGEDQQVLKAVLDPVASQPGWGARHGLAVKFLPCQGYNWAPERHDDDAGMPVVAHFRGPRKPWMRWWYQNFVEKAA